MKVLKATTYRKNKIEEQTENPHLIRFCKDANGSWIVGVEVLKDENFSHIDFSSLVEIEYLPPKNAI